MAPGKLRHRANSKPAVEPTVKTNDPVDCLKNVIDLLHTKPFKATHRNEVENKIDKVIKLLHNKPGSCGENKEFLQCGTQTCEGDFPLHINYLPPDCLTLIFEKFDLPELIPLRAICTLWFKMVKAFCQQKKALKLIENGKSSYFYSYYQNLESQEIERLKQIDCLKLTSKQFFNKPFLTLLSELFSNIKHLIIGKCLIFSTDLFLVKQFPELDGLTICANTNDSSAYQFGEIINSMTKLRRFDLIFEYLKKFEIYSVFAPTLARLERFSLKAHDRLEPIVYRIGPNCKYWQLGNITLPSNYKADKELDMENLRACLALNSKLALNVTHLVLTEFFNIDMLSCIYQNFVNLQFFCIESFFDKHECFSPCALESVLNVDISNLKHLKELKIIQVQFDLDYYHDDSFPPSPLNDLKILYLKQTDGDACFTCDVVKWCEKLSKLFPNLEELTVYEDTERDMLDEIEEHLDLFPKLRTHFFDSC